MGLQQLHSYAEESIVRQLEEAKQKELDDLEKEKEVYHARLKRWFPALFKDTDPVTRFALAKCKHGPSVCSPHNCIGALLEDKYFLVVYSSSNGYTILVVPYSYGFEIEDINKVPTALLGRHTDENCIALASLIKEADNL